MEALDSDATIRNYVEDQLERSVRRKRPELDVRFMDGFDPHPTGPKGLCWRISLPRSQGSWPHDYLVEARLGDREFLIWFGYRSSGAWATHHIMRPAVHVRFQDLGFAAREFPPPTSMDFTLGEVLEEMLFRDTRYSPNVLALT